MNGDFIIEGEAINTEKCIAIQKSLTTSSLVNKIKTLKIRETNLNDEQMSMILKGINYIKVIKLFECYKNEIGENCMKYLVPLIRR